MLFNTTQEKRLFSLRLFDMSHYEKYIYKKCEVKCTINADQIQFSGFIFRVLVLSLLAHCHGSLGNFKIVNVIANTFLFSCCEEYNRIGVNVCLSCVGHRTRWGE